MQGTSSFSADEDEWVSYKECTTDMDRAKWLVENGRECRDGNWEEHLMDFVNEHDGLELLYDLAWRYQDLSR